MSCVRHEPIGLRARSSEPEGRRRGAGISARTHLRPLPPGGRDGGPLGVFALRAGYGFGAKEALSNGSSSAANFR